MNRDTETQKYQWRRIVAAQKECSLDLVCIVDTEGKNWEGDNRRISKLESLSIMQVRFVLEDLMVDENSHCSADGLILD